MKQCRTCLSRNLEPVISLGPQPMAQRFLRPEEIGRDTLAPELDVFVCLDCALIAIEDQVPADFFTHYLYVSSSSDQLVAHFRGFAEVLDRRFLQGRNRRVLDIGSCDGVLLSHCRDRGAEPIGVEPAANLAEIARAKGHVVYNGYFSVEMADRIRAEQGPVAAIATSNTFNIVDRLDVFLEGAKRVLAADGAFVVEVPSADDLIRCNEFDTIYHEHLSQFSLHALAALFARHGMEVFDVEALPIHGGSMRVFAQLRGGGFPVAAGVGEALEKERAAGLFRRETYAAFAERVRKNREATRAFILARKAEGCRIGAYGAAAKGTTLLNYYGLGPDMIDFIADRNPLKHGLLSPRQHIPVVSDAEVVARQPDYLLILAWNFKDEIMRQQSDYARRGGRFLVPIPELQVV